MDPISYWNGMKSVQSLNHRPPGSSRLPDGALVDPAHRGVPTSLCRLMQENFSHAIVPETNFSSTSEPIRKMQGVWVDEFILAHSLTTGRS